MILRRITDFILQGRIQAMGTAFICAFIPLIGTVSIIIAAFVTLRKGIQEGALVLVAATLPILLAVTFLASTDNQPSYAISATDMLVMVVSINLLTWIFAVVLRHTASWSAVLQTVAIIGLATVIIVHLAFPDVQAWWQKWLTNYFTTVEASVKSEDNASHVKFISNMVKELKPYATGIVVMVFSMYAMLVLLIGRWWQDAMYNPGGLRKELLAIHLNRVLGIVFIIGLALSAFMDNEIVRDVMPILYIVFGFAGLSLMHYIAVARKMQWIWLVLIYAVITFVPQTVLLVAFIALLDSLLNIRQRIKSVPVNL